MRPVIKWLTVLLSCVVSGAAFAGADAESAGSSRGGQPGDLLEARGPVTPDGVYYIEQFSTIADYKAATGNDITSFAESPMLTERVNAGKLPPVEERLPDEPYVVVPLDNVGKHGGTFRLIGTGVGEAQHSINAGQYGNLLYRQGSANGKILPYIATSWSNSPDFRTYTFNIRRGVKWSDGAPFTTDDILFWWNDIQLNDDLSPGGPPPQLTSGGDPATFRKVDDHTFRIEFSGPNTLVINFFSGGAELYPWRPAHYLKQFHEDHAAAATLSAMVKDRGFELWNQLFQFHGGGNAWKVDPKVPTLRPWVRTTEVDQAIIFERNPYYWKIDTAGNQLPYMDRSFVDVVSDVEVYKAKAQSGEIDRGDRGLGVKDLALYVANASVNNYQVGLIRQFAAGSPGIFFNMNYPHSEPLRMLFREKDFRVALSLAINRDEINEAFFLGRAHPRQPAPLATDPYYDSDWENAYTVQDVDEANRLLDGLGLTRGGDGFRTYADGSPIETLEITSGNWFAPWGSVMEMVALQWEAVGIRAQVNNVAGGGPYVEKASANELMVSAPSAWYTQLGPWIGAPEVLLAYNWGNGMVHNWGPLWAKWYVSRGEEGEEPPAEVKRIYELWDEMSVAPNEAERDRLAREIVNVHKENLFFIGTVGDWVWPFITHKRIKNVPSNMQTEYYVPEQWYIDE